jgi:UDP-glucuronate decarboxylase
VFESGFTSDGRGIGMAKKRVLVTGGAGFLGSHLVDALVERGNHVIAADNLTTGDPLNLSHFRGNENFHFMLHDVVDPINVEVDQIFNLACPASPIHYQHDAIKTAKTSALGALNLLDLAIRNQARIFQASTSEVYGDPLVHPQKETHWGNVNPVGIRSCYDEGKRFAETVFFDYWRRYNVEIKVGRIFNTYGPRMHPHDGRVVSNFIVQALAGQPLTIYGTGQQTRSFCYVDDLVDAILGLMDTSVDVTGPMNIGNPNEFTMQQLAEMVVELTGAKSKIEYRPLPQDDPKQRCPDITMARDTMDWAPKVQLREGLAKTIAYFEERLRQNPKI